MAKEFFLTSSDTIDLTFHKLRRARVVGGPRRLYGTTECVIAEISPAVPEKTDFGMGPVPRELEQYALLTHRLQGETITEWLESTRSAPFPVYWTLLRRAGAIHADSLDHSDINGSIWGELLRDLDQAVEFNFVELSAIEVLNQDRF